MDKETFLKHIEVFQKAYDKELELEEVLGVCFDNFGITGWLDNAATLFYEWIGMSEYEDEGDKEYCEYIDAFYELFWRVAYNQNEPQYFSFEDADKCDMCIEGWSNFYDVFHAIVLDKKHEGLVKESWYAKI